MENEDSKQCRKKTRTVGNNHAGRKRNGCGRAFGNSHWAFMNVEERANTMAGAVAEVQPHLIKWGAC